MTEVVGVVHVRPAEGKVDQVVAAFAACTEKTHQEEGCLAYALHQDPADPGHLVLVERWRSQADLDQHMTEPWVADLFAVAGTPGMLSAPPELSFVTPLGIGDPAKGSLGG
ncbi:MAG: antibiotic biosynthesis monooxygenase [Frankiaceae bacterium]|nr:antibiotic biosynthesis monooxygenase [Frankiaceae bacterium]